ncbi:hypothetical protein J550_3130, partial [Acinetobacter sp. 230853]
MLEHTIQTQICPLLITHLDQSTAHTAPQLNQTRTSPSTVVLATIA